MEGVPRAQARILAEVNRVAMMASCTVASEVLAEIAILIYRNWGNRSLGDLRLALEMGMSEGPFYGKITYPIIAEWIAAFFRRAEDVAYDRHLSTK